MAEPELFKSSAVIFQHAGTVEDVKSQFAPGAALDVDPSAFLGLAPNHRQQDSGARGATLFAFYTDRGAFNPTTRASLERRFWMTAEELRGQGVSQRVNETANAEDCQSRVLCIGVWSPPNYWFASVLVLTGGTSDGNHHTESYDHRGVLLNRGDGWVDRNIVTPDGAPIVNVYFGDYPLFTTNVNVLWRPLG